MMRRFSLAPMNLLAAAIRKTHALVCWGLGGFVGCALSWGLVADRDAAEVTDQTHRGAGVGGDSPLVVLVYELLDAHADTARLACELGDDPSWAAHLDYLRVLQRKSREALARASGVNRVASETRGSTVGGT